MELISSTSLESGETKRTNVRRTAAEGNSDSLKHDLTSRQTNFKSTRPSPMSVALPRAMIAESFRIVESMSDSSISVSMSTVSTVGDIR